MFCIRCQSEETNKLVKCSGSSCTVAFCETCLDIYHNNQKPSKCPNCPQLFDTKPNKPNEHAKNGFKSDLKITVDTPSGRTQRIVEKKNMHNNGETRFQTIGQNGIGIGEMKTELINEPCEGYDNVGSYKIIFTFNDGIQTVDWLNNNFL